MAVFEYKPELIIRRTNHNPEKQAQPRGERISVE